MSHVAYIQFNILLHLTVKVRPASTTLPLSNYADYYKLVIYELKEND